MARSWCWLAMLLVIVSAVTAVAQTATNETVQQSLPVTSGFMVYVEGYDVKTGLVTLGLSGMPGTYYVEVIANGQVVYSKLTSIPGTITVNARSGAGYQQSSSHFVFNIIVTIYSPDMTKKLYTHGIYIDVYAPKPSITVVGAKRVGAKIVITFRVSTSVKTDVTIYVDNKPVVTDTIFTSKDFNVTVPANKLVNILVVAETDFSTEKLPLYLFIPITMKAGAGATSTTSQIRIIGVTASNDKVRVTVTVPEPATLSLKIDGVPYGSRNVPAGTSTVVFDTPYLKPGTHQAEITVTTESGEQHTEQKIIVVEQKQPEVSPTLVVGAVIVLGILGYLAYKKGLVQPQSKTSL